MIKGFTTLFREFFESEKVAGLFLLLCTIISLTISNLPSGAPYRHLMHHHLNFDFAGISIHLTVEQWVNDGLMAIFFLMVGLEVEREVYVGELSTFKKAIMPAVAAVGGMLVPSLIHFSLNAGTPTQSGFAIPMATDIAFALGMLSLAGNKVPTAVKIFLTALAVIDDIGAILVIAIFYTEGISLAYLGGALGIFLLLMLFNRLRIQRLLLYILPGIIMWYCLLRSGVHATIAGVLLAFAIPFDRHDPKNISYRLQHFLHMPVTIIIIPVFALVNTAIPLPTSNIGPAIFNANTMGIILGLFVGKAAGIFFLPYLLSRVSNLSLREAITWRSLMGVGFMGGIGFTMSIFISNLAFTDELMIIHSKLGILIASALSAVTGLLFFITNFFVAKKKNIPV